MPFPEPPHTQLHRHQHPQPQGASGGLHLPPPAQADPREKPAARVKRVFHQLIPQQSTGDGIRTFGRGQDAQDHPQQGQLQPRGNNLAPL